MEKLGTSLDAHGKVLTDAQHFLNTVRQLSSVSCCTVEAAIGILDQIRRETYEDLNQIQHEHLIVRAAEWLILKKKCPQETEWFWNPRQTGDNSEPDLRGMHSNAIIISAEITTSENPNGTIDVRMKKTLEKLSTMQGEKFYFVRTLQMLKRAQTKVNKAGLQIEVVHIPV